MNRFLHLSTVLVATLAILAVAMGMGGEVVTADNETANNTLSDDIEHIVELYEPEDAAEADVQTVELWASDDRLEQLNATERDRVEQWLEDVPESDHAEDGDDTVTPDRENWTAIDSETHITGWEFQNGEFVVHIHALEETTVTMAESADWEEGSGTYRTMTEDLSEGNNTIYVDTFADESDGVALSFATQLSMEEQRGTYISTGTVAAEDPFRHFGGTSGLFSGVAMTTLLAALAAGIVVWQEDSGVVKA